MNKDIVALAVMVLGIFLLVGWVGWFFEPLQDRSRHSFKWRGCVEQAMVFILYGLGVSGLLLAYVSVRYPRKVAYRFMFVGVVVLVVCYLSLEMLF